MSVAAKIRDAFQREDLRGHGWGASSDDLTEYGIEWNFLDGSKFWLDFSGDEIRIYWRAGSDPHGNGKTIKFKPE